MDCSLSLAIAGRSPCSASSRSSGVRISASGVRTSWEMLAKNSRLEAVVLGEPRVGLLQLAAALLQIEGLSLHLGLEVGGRVALQGQGLSLGMLLLARMMLMRSARAMESSVTLSASPR